MESKVLITLSIDEFKRHITDGLSVALTTQSNTEKHKPDVELLNIKQVCDLLKISKVTLHKWKRVGKIPYYRISNKIYFKKSEIIANLKRGKKL